MAHDHYQLSQFQYDTILSAANGKNPIVVVLETAPGDDAEAVIRLEKQISEVGDMVQLGFLKDVSGKMIENITATKLKTGRGYKAYLITDIGFDMFNGSQKRMSI